MKITKEYERKAQVLLINVSDVIHAFESQLISEKQAQKELTRIIKVGIKDHIMSEENVPRIIELASDKQRFKT